MTDHVYTLRNKDGSQATNKFYMSPYSASAAAVRLQRSLPKQHTFRVEHYVQDIEDVPCDHTVIKDFVLGFLTHLHKATHNHGFALIHVCPVNVCEFALLKRGEEIGQVMITFLPPDDTDNPLGEPVIAMRKCNDKEAVSKFLLLFEEYVSWN